MSQQFFAGATIGTINGGIFVNGTASTLDKLSSTAAHNALHDAPARTDESRCHPYTRLGVLDHLENWGWGICDKAVSIFWLHGGAGAGKSAVMQSLAERFAEDKLLLGSFFFSRSDGTRNTREALIPTLVYQLAQFFPSAVFFLDPILERTPGIFKKSFQVQLHDVFVPILRHLVQLNDISDAPESRRIFLIDGLDECSDVNHQRAIIEAVADMCHNPHIPVKFLIASRPELVVSTAFQWYQNGDHVLGCIALSDDPGADDDIWIFLYDKFEEIRIRHPFAHMLPSDWPSEYHINRLVWKSSSHFIFASTAAKYISSAQESPARSLEVVLGIKVPRTGEPFAELDALGHAAHKEHVLQILAHCFLLPASPSHNVDVICGILAISLNDFNVFMADMTPLIVISEGSVTPRHASLRDFMRSPNRSRSLYVDEAFFLSSRLECFFQLLDADSLGEGAWSSLSVWEQPFASVNLKYSVLVESIFRTIVVAGHLSTTQVALWSYDLRFFAGCLRRLTARSPQMLPDGGLNDTSVFQFLLAARALKFHGRTELFRHQLQCFFDFMLLPKKDHREVNQVPWIHRA